MTTKIIACIDGSKYSPAVCDYAAWAALRLGAPLTFLHVIDRSEYPAQTDYTGNIGLGSREHLLEELTRLDEQRGRLEQEQGRLMLDAAMDRAVEDGVHHPEAIQRNGGLVDTLDDLSDATQMIVIGKRGEHASMDAEHIGASLERVIRHMHRPILVTTEDFKAPENVLLAFDGSETMRKGVEAIAKSPLLHKLKCHVVMIGEDSTSTQAQLEWAQQILASNNINANSMIISGEVESTLRDYKQHNNIDMMIMGAYGHSRIRQLLVGSTTTQMIRKATIPLLILR